MITSCFHRSISHICFRPSDLLQKRRELLFLFMSVFSTNLQWLLFIIRCNIHCTRTKTNSLGNPSRLHPMYHFLLNPLFLSGVMERPESIPAVTRRKINYQQTASPSRGHLTNQQDIFYILSGQRLYEDPQHHLVVNNDYNSNEPHTRMQPFNFDGKHRCSLSSVELVLHGTSKVKENIKI